MAVSSDYETDLVQIDNEICETRSAKVVFESPYPNPVENELTVRSILPGSGSISISLQDLSGKVLISESYKELEAGLHTFILSLGEIQGGIYFLRVSSGDQSESTKIVVK